MTITQKIAKLLDIKPSQIEATIELIDGGNTVPFIARYRKEMTDSLDDEQLLHIEEELTRLRALEKRRESILASIEEQDKLTPELKKQIVAAETMTTLEDLYLPYKQKRRTRASIARENGLQPLADMIIAQPRIKEHFRKIAEPFINDDVPTVDDALSGARDIVAETISENADIRGEIRDKAMRYGRLQSSKIEDAEDEKSIFEIYYEYDGSVGRMRPHQILAINRGESEKILKVKVEFPERDWRDAIEHVFRVEYRSPLAEQLEMAIADSAKRLLLPSIERDVRRLLTELAEDHAIAVFAQNMRGLLSQPPLAGHTVLGLDPGYRTGTKVAITDTTGKVIAHDTIYPHAPQRKWNESLKKLKSLIENHGITLIAIGNGTASRETEQLAAELTRNMDSVHYLIVNEAGASVYSASKLARAELPDYDVTIRGAVSIARRIQDPLAELVKIDPKSIGVGLYQHDVNQKQLSQSLEKTVETVVNQVGVDLNTASVALLTYVAGIGPKLAGNIVQYRDENGKFQNRTTLKKVSGLGAKAFEQAAGFLRVRGGKSPLDASAIHPESYKIAKEVLAQTGLTVKSKPAERTPALKELRSKKSITELAEELNTGVPTLTDIFEQLIRPGRDPREDLPAPLLRSDVLSVDDLQVGMRLHGTVRNVVDFGAFVDIGVKQDGLMHVSKIPRDQILSVGDVLEIEILSVDEKRGRIGLGWPVD
jgi:protein Tex